MGGSIKSLMMNGLLEEMGTRRLHSSLIQLDPVTQKYIQLVKPGFETKCMHSACLVCKGAVVSFGINKYRGISVDFCDHAEADAIHKLPPRFKNKGQSKNRDLLKLDMVVTRNSKTLQMGMSQPCTRCTMYCIDAAPKRGYRICNIYYSTGDPLEPMMKCSLCDLVQEKQLLKMKPRFFGPHDRGE